MPIIHLRCEVLERVDVKNTRDYRQNILSKGLVEHYQAS